MEDIGCNRCLSTAFVQYPWFVCICDCLSYQRVQETTYFIEVESWKRKICFSPFSHFGFRIFCELFWWIIHLIFFYWKKITCDEDHNFWKWIIKRERDKNVTFNSKWPGLKSSNLYNYSMILQGVEIYSCIYITINGSSLKSRYRVITNGNHSGLWFIFTCKFAQDSIHVVLQVHANVLRYKINTSVIQICTLLHKN